MDLFKAQASMSNNVACLVIRDRQGGHRFLWDNFGEDGGADRLRSWRPGSGNGRGLGLLFLHRVGLTGLGGDRSGR